MWKVSRLLCFFVLSCSLHFYFAILKQTRQYFGNLHTVSCFCSIIFGKLNIKVTHPKTKFLPFVLPRPLRSEGAWSTHGISWSTQETLFSLSICGICEFEARMLSMLEDHLDIRNMKKKIVWWQESQKTEHYFDKCVKEFKSLFVKSEAWNRGKRTRPRYWTRWH